MAELATIARPYAEALFKVVGASGPQAWLHELAQVGGDPDMQQFAADPKVNRVQVEHVIAGVLRQPLPEVGVNFLRTIIDNDRLAALPEVARQFQALVSRESGRADAVVQSAFPIHQTALDTLQASLEKRFGQSLQLSVEVVPELIGGVRVVVGDEVLDASVKARLAHMKAALTA